MLQTPGIKVTEVVKQIAKLWQCLSKEEKQRYKEAAKKGRSSFTSKFSYKIFPSKISSFLTHFYLDKERYLRELKELTKSNKTVNKPKKPLTPYMIFVREV